MYSHKAPDQIYSSLAIDVAEPCCKCPMKYGNELSALSVVEIRLLPMVQREVRRLDFAPLSVEENAPVLPGGQFRWHVVPFGHVYKTVSHAGARVHPRSNK
jgi:hypothetical protein